MTLTLPAATPYAAVMVALARDAAFRFSRLRPGRALAPQSRRLAPTAISRLLQRFAARWRLPKRRDPMDEPGGSLKLFRPARPLRQGREP
jgi:hypothetical protein